MRGTDTELLATVLQLQSSCNGHLIALHTPHLKDACLVAQEIQLVALVKDGTAVGSVVLLDVQARRVGFGKEYASIVLAAQDSL